MGRHNLETDDVLAAERRIWRSMRLMFYQTLQYVALYLLILVVYSSFLLTDYVLLVLIGLLLGPAMKASPLVVAWFDFARISLAFLILLLAVFHAILNTYSQIKIDLALSRNFRSGEK